MLEAFVALYPIVILALGVYTAVGTLIGSGALALAVMFDLGGEGIIPRVLWAAAINASGCFGATGALALTKYFLGV